MKVAKIITPQVEDLGRRYLSARRDLIRAGRAWDGTPVGDQRAVAYEAYIEADRVSDDAYKELIDTIDNMVEWNHHSLAALLAELGIEKMLNSYH